MPSRRTPAAEEGQECDAISPSASKTAAAKQTSLIETPAQALQIVHIPASDFNEPPFTIRTTSTKGKGKGCFATRSIPPGTRLVDEPALFSVPDHPLASEIENIVNTLPPSTQNQYDSLSSGSRPKTRFGRFCTNSIQMFGPQRGVFLQTCRFNHSCVPNAYFGYDIPSTRVRIHALVSIVEGEEITINYGYRGTYANREQRRDALRPYGFTCVCPACEPQTPRDRAIEPRRRTMAALYGRISRNWSPHPARVAQKGADLKALRTLLEEAADAGDVMYTGLADTYGALSDWYAAASTDAYCDDERDEEERCMVLALVLARRKLDIDAAATGIGSGECRGPRAAFERFGERLVRIRMRKA